MDAVDEERSTCLTNRRYDESDAKDSKGGEVFNALLRETKNEIEMKGCEKIVDRFFSI